MDPFATVMIHDVSSHAMGKIEDLKASTKEAERLSEWVFRLMSQNCGHKATYFQDLITSYKNADAFFCADECKKHNLVNHIRIPEFTGSCGKLLSTSDNALHRLQKHIWLSSM